VILRKDPAARIIFVTVNNDRCLVEHGLSIGALGFVLKRVAGDELVTAVRAVLCGGRHVSEALYAHP
jgi:DNA-binding NarL/FixJ family response regulator